MNFIHRKCSNKDLMAAQMQSRNTIDPKTVDGSIR